MDGLAHRWQGLRLSEVPPHVSHAHILLNGAAQTCLFFLWMFFIVSTRRASPVDDSGSASAHFLRKCRRADIFLEWSERTERFYRFSAFKKFRKVKIYNLQERPPMHKRCFETGLCEIIFEFLRHKVEVEWIRITLTRKFVFFFLTLKVRCQTSSLFQTGKKKIEIVQQKNPIFFKVINITDLFQWCFIACNKL